VPGKSAQECFNRVHADLSTPAPIAPRPRTSKTQFSPLGHFKLSDSKVPNLLEPLVGRPKTAKQKSLAAQKTVRHLLKKHSLIDQAQEADHFSIFETSPSALRLNIPLEDSPGTPDNCINSFPLVKYSVSSSARKRPLSKLKTKQAELSPAVLKPIKNVVLHERYINQLSRREVAKKPRKKAAGTKATDPEKPLLEQQAGVVKAAKNALMSEATDFICQFKKLQANSLAHVLENSEDDVDNSV
jgi:protein DEK